jgi:anti-sigma-K factor RskA
MSQSAEVHTLAGAYALDALTEIERAAFARHLATCEACATEVAGLTEAASRLALLDAQAPPARLKDAVLNEVYRTRQVGAVRSASAVRSPSAVRGRWLAAVAAAVVGLAGIAGVWAVQESRLSDARDQTAQLQEDQARIVSVLSAPDAQVRAAAADVGGRVTLVVSPTMRDGVVVVAGLPTPAPDRAYQLWLIDDGDAASVGLLPAGTGSGTALLHDMGRADTLGITLEPAGGSPAPTTRVLAGIDLA